MNLDSVNHVYRERLRALGSPDKVYITNNGPKLLCHDLPTMDPDIAIDIVITGRTISQGVNDNTQPSRSNLWTNADQPKWIKIEPAIDCVKAHDAMFISKGHISAISEVYKKLQVSASTSLYDHLGAISDIFYSMISDIIDETSIGDRISHPLISALVACKSPINMGRLSDNCIWIVDDSKNSCAQSFNALIGNSSTDYKASLTLAMSTIGLFGR